MVNMYINKEFVMKHIFIVNPEAGPSSPLEGIKKQLTDLGVIDACEIYVTASALDATEYVRKKCAEEPDETLRFYACGGDGTINEVAAGLIGNSNGELAIYPCGSGNDYVKCIGSQKRFMNIGELMKAETKPVDMMSVCGRYCINVCNFGFDAVVAQTMIDVKRKKIIGGKNAYKTGVFNAVLRGMRNKCRAFVDGEEISSPEGKMLLCTVANGQYVGGEFKCAPRSRNDDGLLEVCYVKPISLFKFLKLLPIYTVGNHLDDPNFKDVIIYRRAKKVEVHAFSEDFGVCIDGEMTKTGCFTIEVLPGAVKLALPEIKS